MPAEIVPMVEGQTEEAAIPILLRRLLAAADEYGIAIGRPFRIKRNRVLKEGELESSLKALLVDHQQAAGILIILDADDACPSELGPSFQVRASKAVQIPVEVVVANREFEAWFLGAKESLRGVRGIRMDATPPADPECIRGAKERLSANMGKSQRYHELADAPAFADCMDLEQAMLRCPSFCKFVRATQQLVEMIRRGEQGRGER